MDDALLKQMLGEMIEAAAPGRAVVPVGIDMPHVRYIVLLQIGMHALADASSIFISAAEKQ